MFLHGIRVYYDYDDDDDDDNDDYDDDISLEEKIMTTYQYK